MIKRAGKWIKVNINNCNVIFEDNGHSEEEDI